MKSEEISSENIKKAIKLFFQNSNPTGKPCVWIDESVIDYLNYLKKINEEDKDLLNENS